jgi:hypothetical protein
VEVGSEAIEAPQPPGPLAEELGDQLGRLEQALLDHTRRLEEVFRVGETASLLTGLAAAHGQLEQELKTWETARRQEMEAKAAEARSAWEAERRRFRQGFDEDKARVTREWEREREEHERTARSRRARLEEEIRATMAERERALAIREREAANAARELEELRSRVQSFPAELAAAVEQARTHASAGVRAQVVAAAKDADVARAILEERVAEAQRLTAQQAARIVELEHDLKDAMDKLKEIVIKTVEGVGALAKAAPPQVKPAAVHKTKP